MSQNPQLKKNALEHYNQFRSLITEALRWLKTTTDTGKKTIVETEAK